MRNHLQHCVVHAINQSPESATATIDELLDQIYKTSR
jgi:DNA-binding FrmR family transcriptional regulator